MNNIESSLIKTITESDLSSIASDITEIGIDSMLDEGLMKDIPIIGAITGVVKTGSAIRDYLYCKKIYRFLSALKTISCDERKKMLNTLGNNQKERNKTGENLLLIIDRLDNVNKPEILGFMFVDYLNGKLNKSTFFQLAKSLEQFNLEMSVNLNCYYNGPSNREMTTDEVLQSLAICGLVGMSLSSGGFGSGGGYRQNQLGKLFIDYVINEKQHYSNIK